MIINKIRKKIYLFKLNHNGTLFQSFKKIRLKYLKNKHNLIIIKIKKN